MGWVWDEETRLSERSYVQGPQPSPKESETQAQSGTVYLHTMLAITSLAQDSCPEYRNPLASTL